MDLQAIAFYLLAAVTVISGFLVITARNPVHSVLFLIMAFFTAAGLVVMLGAEFLAMLLIVVYVGAVAVLFLFVVMMLDVDFTQLREGFARYLPIGMAVGGVLAVEMVMVAVTVAANGAAGKNAAPAAPVADLPNAEAIGRVLYTDYVYIFQASGIVLLIAMIGAIVLTLRHKPGVKRQSVATQVGRDARTAIEVKGAVTGAGLNPEELR